MGRNRTVIPGSIRFDVSGGDWIEIKRQLNTGDQRRLEGSGLKPPVMVGDKVVSPIDWGLFEIERAIIYLTDWSFVGPDEKTVLPLTLDAVRSLDVESFNEINKVIMDHIMATGKAKLEALREAKERAEQAEKERPTAAAAEPGPSETAG